MTAQPGVLELEHLREELLARQPEAKQLLEKLLERSGYTGSAGAFAPIAARRCAACNVAVPSARLQRARAGEFINCSSCSRFLYIEPR